MAPRRPGPGRPSKGKRVPFFTRIPEVHAERVRAEAEARDMAYSEYIAAVVARAHGYDVTIPEPITPVPRQEELGISA